MKKLGLIGTLVFASAGLTPVATHAHEGLGTVEAFGVNRIQAAHDVDQTVERIRAKIEELGIPFFLEIDQSQLAQGADIELRPTKLLIFGNPPLGVQFLTSNQLAGLDWPVRMLVAEGEDGIVWIAWTDFSFIADRYGLDSREEAIAMAREVSAVIASAAK